MSNANKQYLTPEGAAHIKEELEELKGPQRTKIAGRLREAIQQGDLSENADYIKSKEDQGFLEGRIQELETLLSNATIIKETKSKSGKVVVGSFVTIQEGKEDPEKYQVVGAKESDPRNGRISNESPIGLAIMGHSKGETVTVETPNGEIEFTILDVK